MFDIIAARAAPLMPKRGIKSTLVPTNNAGYDTDQVSDTDQNDNSAAVTVSLRQEEEDILKIDQKPDKYQHPNCILIDTAPLVYVINSVQIVFLPRFSKERDRYFGNRSSGQ
jgi:hypothetical protein